MTVDEILESFVLELSSAEQKFPVWPTDLIHAAGIMCEEAGETMQAALDWYYCFDDIEKLKRELVQVGAMAMRCLKNIDQYRRAK